MPWIALMVFLAGCSFSGTEHLPPFRFSFPHSRNGFGLLPHRENVRYVYQGEGSEYASYDVYPDYTDGNLVQQRVNNGGTELVRVLAVKNGTLTRVYQQGEIYYRENYLGKSDGEPELLLMEPIEAGTSWTLADGSIRTITDTAAAVDTPLSSYTAVAVETQGPDSTTIDYYAKGVGLVKSVNKGKDYEVSSSLSEIREDDVFTQTVRFYYPSVNDETIYYRDVELSFHTNDITRRALETAYKEQFSGMPGKVFSDNTRINSYYLNKDGMAYLDLSGEFLAEMNAGSGYEAMILQCVANTFGSYCGAGKVILTVDGGLYESGHIALQKGEYLTVDTENCLPLS
jgi:spore germination protein GerM